MVRQSSGPAHSSVFRGIGIDTTNLVSLMMKKNRDDNEEGGEPECPAGSDDMFGEDTGNASSQTSHALTLVDAANTKVTLYNYYLVMISKAVQLKNTIMRQMVFSPVASFAQLSWPDVDEDDVIVRTNVLDHPVDCVHHLDPDKVDPLQP